MAVGRLRSPHGLSGELKAECLSWNPRRLSELRSVVLVRSGERQDATIEKASPHAAGWRLAFSGVSDPESARLLSGAWICVPESAVTRPQEGWVEADLVGMPVVDPAGARLGRARGLADLPTVSILVESESGTEIVLPLEGPLGCRVDPAQGRIEVEREVWEALS